MIVKFLLLMKMDSFHDPLSLGKNGHLDRYLNLFQPSRIGVTKPANII
ncbi:hypothetical protein BSM4216_2454 [Bacillus smithii]|nr:hypothetical protein BSM4216_2454 [Bacillus smithii]